MTASRHSIEPVMDEARGTRARPMVELRDVCFAYPDGTSVLGGITESIAAGSTVGIVGPSGCGKSTLLAAVAGLIQPTGGTLVRNTAGGDRHPLSMMFQKETVLPWLTVEENVALFTQFKKHGRRLSLARRLIPGRRSLSPEVRELVEELIELVHLQGLGQRYPYQLSGGQRRRLALLTAVAPKPEILLLDEPFSALDEPTRVGIHQDVYRTTRLMGVTTILVTHDLAEALSLADRVLILTKRPAFIAKEHVVPFGDDRSMLDLRHETTFLELYGELWQDLSTQMEA